MPVCPPLSSSLSPAGNRPFETKAPAMGKSRKKKKRAKRAAEQNEGAAAPTPLAVAKKPSKKSRRKGRRGNVPAPRQSAAGPAAPICTCGAQNTADAGDGGIAGFIFMCDARTKPDCFRERVFGLSKKKADFVKRIRAGTVLFLFDVELKILYGVYQAISEGGVDLVPEAFGGKFTAQVKFKIDKDCLPLHESVFRHAIQENYRSKHRFRQDLSYQQVSKLLQLFRSITLPQQPPPSQIVDDPYRSGHTTSIPSSVEQIYGPQFVPTANKLNVPAVHYGHTPPAVDHQHVPPAALPHAKEPCHLAPPCHPCHHGEHARTYYTENQTAYECASCRVMPEMIPRDHLPTRTQQSQWTPGNQDPDLMHAHSSHSSQAPAFNRTNMASTTLCSCCAAAAALAPAPAYS